MTNAWLSLAHNKVWADPGPAAPTASSGLPPDRAVRATGCGASAPPPGYRSDRSPGAPYADARSHCRAPGRTLGCCAVSSLVRQRVSWLLRHSLRGEPGGRLVVLRVTISRGKRPDGLPVSTALTSQAHRRRTPKKNRRIPTISAGNIGGRLVHVSAVDTGPRRSESGGFLVVEPGAVAVWNHRHNCLRPCVVCRAQPPPPGSHHTSPTS